MVTGTGVATSQDFGLALMACPTTLLECLRATVAIIAMANDISSGCCEVGPGTALQLIGQSINNIGCDGIFALTRTGRDVF